MSHHAATALDQLRLADEFTDRVDATWEQQAAHALTAAQVHATLALADAVRTAGAMALHGPRPVDVA